MYKQKLPTCKIKKKCFGKRMDSNKCQILTETAPTCSFCKEFRDVTNGRLYPNKYKGDTHG